MTKRNSNEDGEAAPFMSFIHRKPRLVRDNDLSHDSHAPCTGVRCCPAAWSEPLAERNGRQMSLLTRLQLESIRDECFADDIDIDERMHGWSEDQVRSYFLDGGLVGPQTNVELGHVASATPNPSTVKIFGDSHANTFISIESSGGGPEIIGYPYTAGSAMGLRHADSITGYRQAVESDLRDARPNDLLVFKFGQVDCDFVYYLKWMKDPSLLFETFAVDAVRKYFTFVDDVLAHQSVSRSQLCIVRLTSYSATALPPHPYGTGAD